MSILDTDLFACLFLMHYLCSALRIPGSVGAQPANVKCALCVKGGCPFGILLFFGLLSFMAIMINSVYEGCPM